MVFTILSQTIKCSHVCTSTSEAEYSVIPVIVLLTGPSECCTCLYFCISINPSKQLTNHSSWKDGEKVWEMPQLQLPNIHLPTLCIYLWGVLSDDKLVNMSVHLSLCLSILPRIHPLISCIFNFLHLYSIQRAGSVTAWQGCIFCIQRGTWWIHCYCPWRPGHANMLALRSFCFQNWMDTQSTWF